MANSTNNSPLLQIKLFDSIQQLIPSNSSLADALCEILNLSTDSAYRRLRGSTILTIDETAKICNHFNVSIDTLLNLKNSNQVLFNYMTIEKSQKGFILYLESVLSKLKKLSQQKNAQLFIAANDIPFFYLLLEEDLYEFKMFYWLKSILQIEEFANTKFNYGVLDKRLMEVGKELFDCFLGIPSVEFWNDHTIMSIVKQINYYEDAVLFEKPAIRAELLEKLKAFNTKLLGYTSSSYKNANTSGSELSLYITGIEIGNNCILAVADNFKEVAITYNTMNNLSNQQQFFIHYIEEWMECLKKKSTLISGISEKERLQFFHSISAIISE